MNNCSYEINMSVFLRGLSRFSSLRCP